MDTETRLDLLEERLAYYDRVVTRLILYARLTPNGRLLLKALGLQ